MRTYTIKKQEHHVYEAPSEIPSDLPYLKDWRKAEIGDWVLADDGCIIQVLRKNAMAQTGRTTWVLHTIGTCTGTFLISPTVPIQPFKFGEIKDPVQFMKIDYNTVTSNLTGKPAISVPYKIVNGLPIGIQIMADSFKDHSLLQAAYALEKTVKLPEVPI